MTPITSAFSSEGSDLSLVINLFDGLLSEGELMTIRLILRERLSIERGNAEVVREPASLTESDEPALVSSLPVPLAQGTSPLLSASAPQRNETETRKDWADSAGRGLPSLVATPLLTQPVTVRAEMKSRDLLTILAPFSQSLRVLIVPSLINSVRQKVVVPCSKLYKTVASFYKSRQVLIQPLLIYSRQKMAAGSILLILIPTAVMGTISGLVLSYVIKAKSNVASSLRTGKQTVPLNVSLPPAASALAPSIVSPANSHDENKSLQIRANAKAMRRNAQPSTVHLNLEAPLKNKDIISLPANAPHGDEKATSPLEVRALEEKPASNPSYRAIAVVVQIEHGRVKQAYIQNPQVGLRAFEATALRLVRERRYAKDTKRKETVILRISANPIKPLP